MTSNELSSLKPNQPFHVNDRLESLSSIHFGFTYWLTLQEDGNLVLYKAIKGPFSTVEKEPLWASHTKAKEGENHKLKLIIDEHIGNLVL
jgi:hypothetical protein